MTKRMREIQAEILKKSAEATSLLDNKDLDKAAAVLDEIDALQKEFDLAERAEKLNKSAATGEGVKPVGGENSTKAFADAARRGFKGMSEGSDPDGGYTVPEDIQTQINQYRDAKRSLRDLVTVVPVTTKDGARTFKARAQQTGFVQVGEGAAIGAKATPQFTRLTYSIKKYAGIFPVTNELLADSDANIVNEIVNWAGDESRVTGNKLILAKIATKAITALTGLDDIKKALNITLGQAFKGTSKIVTNDDGLQYLDTLKDKDGDYVLQPMPSEPMKLQLCAGATVVPVEVIPNADMPSADVYLLTTDTDIVAGKTYYTKSDDKYSEVASPTKTNIGTYYEKRAGVPFVIGDLKEGIAFFDRQQMTLKQSDVAAIGTGDSALNAFEDDLLLIRATEREDVVVRDAAAFVNGQIVV